MPKEFLSFRKGFNWRLPAYRLPKKNPEQCVLMQNLRWGDGFMEGIPGTIRYNNATLGTDPITAVMPYYNTETNISRVLIAYGGNIAMRNDAQNNYSTLKGGLTSNRILFSADRHNIKYITHPVDGLFKFPGGQKIYNVGGGATKPPNMTDVIFVREVDRLFGLKDHNLFWCDLGEPEVWDAANVDRIKSVDGDVGEKLEVLYGKVIILNTYSIWIYYILGNEENWRLELAPTTVGCIAPKTVKRVGNEIWFLGESPKTDRGVYAFNGSQSRLLTDDITPLLNRINRKRISESCAELNNDLYTLSFPLDASLENDHSIDLDVVNVKEDGVPAIYGPHTLSFFSSGVLNTRMRSGETIFGHQSSGFTHRLGGTSFDSIAGLSGDLIQHRFLGPSHNDDSFDIVKKYDDLKLFFPPRGFHNLRMKLHFSHSPYGEETNPYFQAVHTRGELAGQFDPFEKQLQGVPELFQATQLLGAGKRGTAIQLELINDTIDQKFAFQGYSYKSRNLYTTRKVQGAYVS